MRLIFICLSLGALFWFMQGHQVHTLSPMGLGGFILLAATTGWRLCEQWRISGAIGALLVGFGIGQTQLVDPDQLITLAPFSDIVLAWMGLHMATSLTQPLLINRRLLASAALFYFPAFCTGFLSLIYLGFTLPTALHLATLAGMGAPLFMLPKDFRHSDTRPLCLLTTSYGLIFWGLGYLLLHEPFAFAPFQWAINLTIGVVAIELFVRAYLIVRTEAGRIISWFLLVLLIVIFGWAYNIPSLTLALILGLGIALRSKTGCLFLIQNPFSEMLTAFAVTYIAIIFSNPLPFDWATWPISHVLLFGLAIILGKIAGGSLMRYFFSVPITTWLPLIPLGPITALCLAATTSSPLFPPIVYIFVLGFLPLLFLRLAMGFARKIKSGRQTRILPVQTTAS